MTYNSLKINDLQKKAHWVMTPNGLAPTCVLTKRPSVLFEITVVSIPTLLWQLIFSAALTRSLTGLLLSHLSVGVLRLYVEETLMDTPSVGIPIVVSHLVTMPSPELGHPPVCAARLPYRVTAFITFGLRPNVTTCVPSY